MDQLLAKIKHLDFEVPWPLCGHCDQLSATWFVSISCCGDELICTPCMGQLRKAVTDRARCNGCGNDPVAFVWRPLPF